MKSWGDNVEKLLEILSSHVREDEGNLDIASFPLRNTTSRATVFLKTENVVASGIELAQRFLEKYHLKSIFHVKDGEFIPKKGAIGEIEGNTYSLLLIERTLLNTLSLMFSTATVTRRFARKLKHAKIAATRKIDSGFFPFPETCCDARRRRHPQVQSGRLRYDKGQPFETLRKCGKSDPGS